MRVYPHLEKIDFPSALKELNMNEMPALCMEIREFLIESVSKTGGHLASSLGAVEICAGIHRVFSAPQDSVVFDVGHQAYAHKILTGRREAFSSLRKFNGISGFLRPAES
jgi:1-deoxy-D-xylulose-5-phosphate synthase